MTRWLVSLKPILVVAEDEQKARGEALKMLYHGFEPKVDDAHKVIDRENHLGVVDKSGDVI